MLLNGALLKSQAHVHLYNVYTYKAKTASSQYMK
jgi:hypothetical protein